MLKLYAFASVSAAVCLAHPLETVLVDDGDLPLVTSLLLAHFLDSGNSFLSIYTLLSP